MALPRMRFRLTAPAVLLSVNAVPVKQFFWHTTVSRMRRYTSTPLPPPQPEVSADLRKKPSEPRLSLTFTCSAPSCSHRSTHEFTKASYERGVVLVQCPGCKSRHLIADHLGWFKEHKETVGGTLRTIEDFMKAKGEKVIRGRLDAGGVVEYVDE